jgi:hypothetical protein
MDNMKLIEAKTVGAGGIASLDFTAIPQTYTDLKIVYSARANEATTAAIGYISFNGSTSNFTNSFLQGNGATVQQGGIDRFAAYTPGTSNTANIFSNGEIYIPNYTSTTTAKSFLSESVVENNDTTGYCDFFWNLWNPGTQAAITSVSIATVASSWIQNSTFYLYGIQNTITGGAKAYGGYVSEDTNYWYHTFLSSGVFTPTQNITADYLVIAGGAGGGSFIGAGGGAGGLRSTVGATGGGGSLESALSLTANTGYVVTIGAGGAGGISASTAPGNGSNSEFSTITSTGGGRGGYWNTSIWLAGGNGGSGGGGGIGSTAGGTRTTNQGYDGGAGGPNSGGTSGAGGGGGAGAVGTAGANNAPGNGGNGVSISAFANATLTGVNTYYAGGGGGGGHNYSTPRGAGGLGGGGQGANTDNGVVVVPGIVNTGSGGGGNGVGPGQNGASGGSGLVIVRYAK